MRDDQSRLRDILEAIDNVERYIRRGQEDFFRDELVRVWVVHHIQIIGEAAANISQDFRDRRPQIPWAQIVAMRNILVHHYFGIDWQEVWATALKDLPVLKVQLLSILEG